MTERNEDTQKFIDLLALTGGHVLREEFPNRNYPSLEMIAESAQGAVQDMTLAGFDFAASQGIKLENVDFHEAAVAQLAIAHELDALADQAA